MASQRQPEDIMGVCKGGRSAPRTETAQNGKCLKGKDIENDAAEVRGLP